MKQRRHGLQREAPLPPLPPALCSPVVELARGEPVVAETRAEARAEASGLSREAEAEDEGRSREAEDERRFSRYEDPTPEERGDPAPPPLLPGAELRIPDEALAGGAPNLRAKGAVRALLLRSELPVVGLSGVLFSTPPDPPRRSRPLPRSVEPDRIPP